MAQSEPHTSDEPLAWRSRADLRYVNRERRISRNKTQLGKARRCAYLFPVVDLDARDQGDTADHEIHFDIVADRPLVFVRCQEHILDRHSSIDSVRGCAWRGNLQHALDHKIELPAVEDP